MLDILIDALRRDRTVMFAYDDKPRVVEIHAIGTSTKDAGIVVRGYQVGGDASRPLPAWHLFRLDRIPPHTLAIGPRTSEAPRPGYARGDRQMADIIAQIDV